MKFKSSQRQKKPIFIREDNTESSIISVVYLLLSLALRVGLGLLVAAWLVNTEGLVMWSALGADTWRRITGFMILGPPPGANTRNTWLVI